MARAKNKRISSDKVHNKLKNINSTTSKSPFEVHINNEKLKVLGRKNKHNKGLPGISRGKAIDKRVKTLLHEYKIRNKSNIFTDRRIGEHNQNLSSADKQLARFAAVRMKAHNRKSIYNLGEDEILTHKGQTLSEIEKFDDPRSDDDDIDDETGKLDDKFTEEAHFGGGLLKKTGNEGAKSHKDLIQQLIADSKKRKAEKQKIKENTLELTEKLDTEWKDLLPLVSKSTQKPENEIVKPKVDDYDKVMRELKFEARGIVSDRLKTEEEVAKDEKDKFEQLENERIQRMKGIIEEKKTSYTHRSADDLDDNFVWEPESDFVLSYDMEGQSNLPSQNAEEKIEQEAEEFEEDDESNEESGDDNDFSDLKAESENSENEDENSENKIENSEKEDENSDNEVENSGNEVENGERENENSENKVENSDNEVKNGGYEVENGEKEDENSENEVENSENEGENSENEGENSENEGENSENEVEDCEESETEVISGKSEIKDLGIEGLPNTFSCPETYDELESTLSNYSCTHQGIIIERMIKCNHPSLEKNNKEKLAELFTYILQYLNNIASKVHDEESIRTCFSTADKLMPHLYDLAQINQNKCYHSVLELTKEKFKKYWENPKEYPGVEVLIIFKVVSLLFPTSDFRHQIVTPCLTFMEEMLIKCKARTKRQISYGLFVATLVLEYTALSKRYMPGCINYLGGVLHMAIPKTVRLVKVIPPFQLRSSDLVLTEEQPSFHDSIKMETTDLINSDITDSFKLRALHTTIKIIHEFFENLKNLPSSVEIFEPISRYCQLIPIDMYPEVVRNEIVKFIDNYESLEKQRRLKYIVMTAKKPKALRLYEPKIEEVYDGKKYKKQSREKAERDKLLHKIKREKHGALREIRRDNAFLGRVKLNHQIQSDKDRREKVKRIFAEASIQQSELNSMDRKKKKK